MTNPVRSRRPPPSLRRSIHRARRHLIALYGTAQARTFHIPREAPLYANAVHADLHRQRAFAAMASKAVS